MSTLAKGLKRARAARHLTATRAAPIPAEPVVPAAALPFDIANLASVEPDRRCTEHHRIVLDERSAASSSYKVLRTRVHQRMRRSGWRTLAVTGAGPGEGKSLTAINLAIQLARQLTTSVVLVDLDLRNPSIHHRFGIEPHYGLLDHLMGAVPLERIAVRPGIERLGVIMNDQPIADSSELISSPKAAALVKTLKTGDDRLVVFDMPPALAGDDVLAFAPLVDAMLVVVSEGKTARAGLTALHELLQNVNVIGTVLNESAEDVAPYYYGPQ